MEQSATNVTFFAAIFIVAISNLIIVLPRRLAVLPVMMTVSYLTLGQVIDVGGLHFTWFRLALLVGWIRVLSRREFEGLSFNIIDKAFIVWAAVRSHYVHSQARGVMGSHRKPTRLSL